MALTEWREMARRFRAMSVLPVAAAFWPALLCGQQPAASEEIRVSSQPYVVQAPTFHAEARLVDVGVAVRDGHGHAVAGLKREDFRIYDDGKERGIANFSEHRAGSDSLAVSPVTSTAPAPQSATAGATTTPGAAPPARFLAVFFDDVNAAFGEEAADLKRAQAAASHFVKASLQPGIRIGIFTASGTETLDYTADAARLLEAIAGLRAHPHYSSKVCFGINPYQAYRIAQERDQETIRLVARASANSQCPATPNQVITQSEEIWRRVKEATTETFASLAHVVGYLGGKPGERVLLMASTGFASGTLEPQENRIIDQAIQAGVVINALVTKGLYNELTPGERLGEDPQPRKAVYTTFPGYRRWAQAEAAEVAERPAVMDEAMANLAHGTGGVLFENNNDLNAGFRETSIPPEVTYRISFNPEDAIADGSYHQLQVKLVHPASYSVEARPGYFAREEMAGKLRANLDKQVMASDALAGMAAGVALQMEKRSDSQREVRVIVHLDISKLEFAKQNDRQTQRIAFVAAFFDSQGKIVTAKEGRMDLALKPETYGRLANTGVNAELTFQMPPGVYKLRAVVEEALKGGMAASTYPIDVR
jgi:VWFA-related protein